jgi:DNA invertase Pin-like site-specific DNA recombinase
VSAPERGPARTVVKGPWPEWLGRSPAEQAAPRIVRAAFAARVSTDDQQDPTLSLPRQLANCQKALPEDMVVALHFYDVESGRTDLESRGKGEAYKKFNLPIPRDGGIDDLLAEAKRPDRRFDVVICELVHRIARTTYYGTKIEHELEQAGSLLLAADEGITMARRRATSVLTRRMKQGIAEWYVLDMLEKAWGGFEVHTKQGWNIGQPPYGYVADSIPHPVPARRAEGKHKTWLVPDPVRAATVKRIYELRITERLGYRLIADRLNEDLALNPPPVPPDAARAVGRWTGSSVREILHTRSTPGTWSGTGALPERRQTQSRRGLGPLPRTHAPGDHQPGRVRRRWRCLRTQRAHPRWKRAEPAPQHQTHLRAALVHHLCVVRTPDVRQVAQRQDLLLVPAARRPASRRAPGVDRGS